MVIPSVDSRPGQERKFLPVGATAERGVDVRVVTARHQNLEAALARRKLREDLFYRINEVTLSIPPLRNRETDVQLPAHYFLSKVWPKVGLGQPVRIPPEAVQILAEYHWPGNVRQPEKVITSLSFNVVNGVITADLARIEVSKAKMHSQVLEGEPTTYSLDDFIRTQARERLTFIHRVIDRENGSVSAAAERLKIRRATLYKMRERLARRAT